MRLKKRERACSLASSPTIAPHRTHIKLVSNRSLLGELGGLSNNKQMSLANECSILKLNSNARII
ncbi:hypothetical protein BIZ43_01945 [Helicobacter pylori]|nr:hypothetical protein BIZ43_01945 [Helicobacter pylori]